jgi:tRNA-specific 2-thiouridylase
MTKVVVAMSGGVDSSAAAALLVEQGYDVTGVMLRLWSPAGCDDVNRCCTPEAMGLARQVAAQIGIPFYALDARESFRRVVVQYFLDSYQQGITPNPCLACNQHIRWGFLLDQALAMGADYLATGHYARLDRGKDGSLRLLRGVDRGKDQTYVLSMLTTAQLSHSLFPLGGFQKTQVRQMAADRKLPVAERPDSQDLCFLGEGDYRQFLAENLPQVVQPGQIVDTGGRQLGEHQGLAFYTIGQRKGIRIAAPEPLYVIRKDMANNMLVVGRCAELGGAHLVCSAVNWVSGKAPDKELQVQVKIRYQAEEAWALIWLLDDGRVDVTFDRPLRDITPGQTAVFYDGETCLGGGIICEG